MDTGPTVVRTLRSGVVVSVAVHAALVGGLYAWEPAPREEVPPEMPVVVEIVEVVEPAAAAVARDEREREPEQEREREREPVPAAAPIAVAAATPPPAASQPAAPEISTGTRATIETTPPPGTIDPSTPPTSRSKWFDLRGGRGPAVDLRLPRGFRDDLDNVPRGTNADRGIKPTGQLQESGGGTYRSDQGPFTAKVAPDGSVTLKDKRNLQVGFALPKPKQIAQGVSQWYYSDKGLDGQRGERTLEKEVGGSTDAGDRSKAVVVPVFRGGFDVTDAFMRSKGADPYASKKLAFLDSTRDERVQIGTKHREQQLRLTPQIIRKHLDRAWSLPEVRARREALFELWDEVVETGDAGVVEAGRAARLLVIGFIRAHLPAGGSDAYTADELAALNRRKQSKERFAPYD